MEDIRDCKGRLACRGDTSSGLVESLYKGCRTQTRLAIGTEFVIERDGIVTTITRVSQKGFIVDSHPIAA